MSLQVGFEELDLHNIPVNMSYHKSHRPNKRLGSHFLLHNHMSYFASPLLGHKLLYKCPMIPNFLQYESFQHYYIDSR
jgi:hypothetical protein